jgi:hypothetical protein
MDNQELAQVRVYKNSVNEIRVLRVSGPQMDILLCWIT